MQIEYRLDKECLNPAQLIELFKLAATWKMPVKHTDWEDMIANTPLVISAWDDQKIVGFARLLTDFVRWADLYDVVVHPGYQGKGIGKQLVLGLIEHPKLSRVRTVTLGTEDKFEFYEKLGFTRYKENYFMQLVRKDRDMELFG